MKEILEKKMKECKTFNGFITHLRFNIEMSNKIKRITNTENNAEATYLILNEMKKPKCPVCKKNYLKFVNFTRGYRQNCSKECLFKNKEYIKKLKDTYNNKSEEQKKIISQSISKTYQSKSSEEKENIKKTREKTNFEKFGNIHSCNAESIKEKINNTYHNKSVQEKKEIQEKRENTIINKFGSKYALQNQEVLDKLKKTNLEKYGFEYAIQNQEVLDKIKKTNLEKYGFENPMQNKEISNNVGKTRRLKEIKRIINSERIKSLVIPLFDLNDYKGQTEICKWKCKKCNNIFEDKLKNKIPRCTICYPLAGQYRGLTENYIKEWLEKMEIKIEKNSREIIKPLEIDLFLPEYNLGIEFNGLYWHSSKFKEKNYHLNKTKKMNELGHDLIHVFDSEWIEKQDIIKSIIKSKIGKTENKIFGRKCIIKKVNKEETKQFLLDNHLQGIVNSSINLGLYYEDELVQICTFGKSRFNKKYDYELLRSCSKLNTQITGGFNKLIKYFKNNYKGTIISYVDKRYFNGNGYKNWTKLKDSNPNYFYIIKGKLESRLKYQKHKLENLLEEFDPNLTEATNMELNGHYRIFDCGNMVFAI